MPKIVWEKGKPPTLLVGIQIGAATTENSTEVPLKKKKQTKHRATVWFCNHTPGNMSREN